MHGFISIISLQSNDINLDIKWKPLFDFQPEHSLRKLTDKNILIEQYSTEKFLHEKFLIQSDDYIFVNEGIIINTDLLINNYQCQNRIDLVAKLTENEELFFKQFEGNFCGFYFNKKNNTVYAFNNQAGTRKLFYFHNHDFIIISTDLYTLNEALNSLKIPKTHDTEAAAFLLTSGFMHEDHTLINEIKQIRAGEYLKFAGDNLQKDFYFSLSNIPETIDDRDTIINNLEKLFVEAIRLEFDFSKKQEYIPLTTLSGGLDSRMVALMSHDLGYSQKFFNFSEKDYADEIIAREIAQEYDTELIFHSLSPECLMRIDEIVAVNDGLTIYSGAGHVFEAVKTLMKDETGIIHTGILGDGYMGSYVNHNKAVTADISSGVYSARYISKVKGIILKSISGYKSEELYKFYNRAFMGINNGFLYFNLIGESFSAFTYTPFAAYAFSVPTYLKYRKRNYINWIKKKHPEYARFVWESIGGKPTNNLILRFYYRFRRAIIKRLPIKSMWKNTMNPEQLWYDTNPQVKQCLDNYFHQNIHRVNFNPSLQADVTNLYKEGSITEKTQVLTLLAAYKLHFSEN